MAGINPDPFSGLGEQTYVDFVALSECLAQSRPVTTTATRPTTTNSVTNSASVVQNRSVSSTTAAITRPRVQTTPRIQTNFRRQSSDPQAPSIPPRATDPQLIAENNARLQLLRAKDEEGEEDEGEDDTADTRASSRRTWSGAEICARVAIASHNYVPVSDDDLSMKKGDVLEILEDRHRWWYAKNTSTGKRGYIPSNHVKYEIPLNHDKGWKVETMLFSDTPRGRYLVRGVEDFCARAPEEVTCRVGDVCVVLNDNSKWWFVRHIKTGKEGFVPKIYLKRCDEEDEEEGRLPDTLGYGL